MRTNVAELTDEEVAVLAEQAARRPETPSLSTSTPKAEENKRFTRKPTPRGIILRMPPKRYEVVDVVPDCPQERQWDIFFEELRGLPPEKSMAVYPDTSQTSTNLQLQVRRASKRHGVSIVTFVRNYVVYVRMA